MRASWLMSKSKVPVIYVREVAVLIFMFVDCGCAEFLAQSTKSGDFLHG